MIPKLIVYHHLGLGDHFICNGLVHHLLEHVAGEIWLPTKEANAKTVRQLYADYETIKIVTTNESDPIREALGINNLSISYNTPMLKISYNGDNNKEFDRAFYDQIGLEFHYRWAFFRMPFDDSKALEFYNDFIKNPDEPYALVHNSGSVGKFDLDIKTTKRIVHVEPGHTDTLLDWRYVIERASEIHCIDSSVIHLADSLRLDAGTLVYHDVGRGSRFNLTNDWEVKTYK